MIIIDYNVSDKLRAFVAVNLQQKKRFVKTGEPYSRQL